MKITTKLLGPIEASPDLLILTAGFEDRCLAILKYLNKIELKDKHVILLYYVEQDDLEVNLANKKNEDQISNYLQKRGDKFKRICLNHINSLETMIEIKNYFKNANTDILQNILIDISSIKDSVMTLMTIFLLKLNSKNLKFIYTIPMEYHLVEISKRFNSMEEFIQKILDNYYRRTTNPLKIAPFEGFEGLPDPTQPTRIIFLAGFEANKVLIVCKRFEDSWVTKKKVLIGTSLLLDNEDEREFSRDVHTRLTQGVDLEFSSIECHDVNKIISNLDNLIKPFVNTENIILCCFGTKLQMLACTIYAYKNPKVTLLKVQMGQYIPKYFSKGINKSLEVEIIL